MLPSNISTSVQKPLRLRRVNHSDEIVSGFTKLLKSESMTDVTLICNGGYKIKAHRVILSTFSSYFKSIFESQPFTTNSCQYPVIVIKDLSYNELRTMIEFIYRGEVSVSRDKLSSILQAAKALEVSGLSELKGDSYISSSTTSNSSNNNSNNNNSNNNNEDTRQNGLGSFLPINMSVNGANNNNWKRGQESLDEFNSSDNSLKKSRISLDSGINNFDNALNLGLLGDSSMGTDDVRSLLQQASRLSALGNLKSTIQKQYNQQHKTNLTLEQFFQQKQRALLQQKILDQQNQLKNQILQNQLMSKSPTKSFTGIKNGLQNETSTSQEKQKDIQEKISNAKSPRSDTELKKSKSPNKEEIGSSQGQSNQEEGEDVLITNGDKSTESFETEGNTEDNKDHKIKNESDNESESKKRNGESSDKSDEEKDESIQVKQEDEEQIDLEIGRNGIVDPDVSEIMEQEEMHEDEYSIDIDKDKIFQKQQELRLKQLQKQQQFQNQLQLQLQQEQQEAKLFELHRQLQRINSSNEPEDLSTNLSLDWQEGFIDESFPNLPTIENDLFNASRRQTIPLNWLSSSSTSVSLSNTNGRISNKNREIHSTSSTTGTPDFLLPRGPGRPRKGNKTQDISPCPECNKVFVRPDVLKLHYRSVHLNERHPCNMCPKIFKWPGDLSKHKRTKHREEMALANSNTINVTTN